MKYRKKPVVIEAIQFDGTNAHQICEWVEGKQIDNPFAMTGNCYIKQYGIPDTEPLQCIWRLVIKTLEGEMEANQDDWIIKGVKGEFYPCKPDIFEATYEATAPAQGGEK